MLCPACPPCAITGPLSTFVLLRRHHVFVVVVSVAFAFAAAVMIFSDCFFFGADYDERVLPSIVNEVTKAVVAKYNASELLTKREVWN